jgi:hypothetical protein
MTWNTEKQAVRTILERHLNGDSADLCMRYFEVVKSVDAVAQGDAHLWTIPKAYTDILTGFIGNKFFEQHKSYLIPSMVHGLVAWVDGVGQLKDTGLSEEAQVAAHMSRRQFHEVACMCATLLGRDASPIRKELTDVKTL